LNGGEKRLDGYCESTNTAYEFHGCVFHGCSICDRDQVKPPRTNQSMEELYALTMRKKVIHRKLGNEIQMYLGTRVYKTNESKQGIEEVC